ncbi:MAG: histidine phosphatase family protein [Actinomycetota bacterium]|nr:histidine phosphatase family protein [Actinomycetota bacterium]
MRLFVLARHAESVLNVEQRVNGDPTRPAGLTDAGREEARLLGLQLRDIPIDRCVHTRFSRTRETALLVLEGRNVPLATEPLLDDIDVGDLEGSPIAEYRAWKRSHLRSDAFPAGESLDDAARRYAKALRNLLDSQAATTLVVCHEIPVRYALNASGGSDALDSPVHDIPNATPFLFDDAALSRAAERIELLVTTIEAEGTRSQR